MRLKQKLVHLYTYYSKSFFIILFLVFLVTTFLGTIIKGKSTTEIFYCAIINNNMERSESSYLLHNFSSICQPTEREYITFDYGNPISYGSNSAVDSLATLQKLFSKSQAGELDCIISSSEFSENYGSGILVDLSDYLPQDQLIRFEELLIYAPNEDGALTPYGIDISQSHIIQGAGIYVPNPTLSVGSNSKHLKSTLQFIQFVMSTNE